MTRSTAGMFWCARGSWCAPIAARPASTDRPSPRSRSMGLPSSSTSWLQISSRNVLRPLAVDRRELPGELLARLDAVLSHLQIGQTGTCVYALGTQRRASRRLAVLRDAGGQRGAARIHGAASLIAQLLAYRGPAPGARPRGRRYGISRSMMSSSSPRRALPAPRGQHPATPARAPRPPPRSPAGTHPTLTAQPRAARAMCRAQPPSPLSSGATSVRREGQEQERRRRARLLSGTALAFAEDPAGGRETTIARSAIGAFTYEARDNQRPPAASSP